jgi:NADPH:quinone reductase
VPDHHATRTEPTVHAIRQHAFGGPEQLVLEELPDLEPDEGQVRIAVAAAGVHVIDTSIRTGQLTGPFPRPDLPMTPGREVAGTVDAVGPGVDPGWLGRPVVAHLGAANGGYADSAVAATGSLHVLPSGHRPEEAGAMIGTGRTVVAILDAAAVTGDDVVVVTAAVGGIGTLLVQAAVNVGAVVVGLAGGAAKVARARDDGAIGVD